jgi:hypothetical protein
MKKFVVIALMLVSLCAVGCSGDTKKPITPTPTPSK